jgi:5'-methylthioadenosine phosphorylase
MSQVKVGLIGGSGLGEALLATTSGTRHEVETPFGMPSDAIIEAEWAGLPVLCLSRHGPGHVIPPSQVPSRANIFALKQLGCTHIIASGAVGSLREEFRPRDLVIPDQVIDKTYRRSGTFYERAAVHVELGEPFCPVLRRMVVEVGRKLAEEQAAAAPPAPAPQGAAGEQAGKPVAPGFRVHDRGCYVCMEGPQFSTRAESLMHRLWGGDIVGMTAMPEAKLAKEAEISYVLVSLVTDYDCWRQARPAAPGEKVQEAPDSFALLREIIGNLEAATTNAIHLMQHVVKHMAEHQDELAACPAQQALKLAIWSAKSRIAPEEVQRLRPLWGRYFEGQ